MHQNEMKNEKFINAFKVPFLALDIFSSKWEKYIFLASMNMIPSIVLVLGELLLTAQIYQNVDLYKLTKEYNIKTMIMFIFLIVLQAFTYTLTSTAIFILTKEQGATFKQAISQALKMFFPVFFTGTIVFIIVLAGYVLLIIPGIILTVWYIYTLPCTIEGNRGMQVLSCSKSLVRGRFWKTLAGIIVPSLTFSILGHVIQLPFEITGKFLVFNNANHLLVSLLLIVGEFVKTVVVAPLITISLYILYKSAKETHIRTN